MPCINSTQAFMHIAFEFLAVLLIPWMIFVSYKLDAPHNWIMRGVAIVTLIVDGGLLINWVLKK